MRYVLLISLLLTNILISGCSNSDEHSLSTIQKLQEKILNDKDYVNANLATKESINKKFNIKFRSVRMLDGKVVENVPNYVSDDEVKRRYNNSVVQKKNQLPLEEFLKKLQEEANKDAQKAIKELEANKNRAIYQAAPKNYLEKQLESQILQNNLDWMETQQKFRDQELMFKLQDIEDNQERIINNLR